jgi:SAM-dependent methyltransferase
VIVSRGSFQFWGDQVAAFREIYRVLKPGGVAWIGRGFSPNLPVETAEKIRERQRKPGSFPKYDVEETEQELREVLRDAGVAEYQIHIPDVRNDEGEKVNYGIWVEFRKIR